MLNLKNVLVYDNGNFQSKNITINDSQSFSVSKNFNESDNVINNCILIPGLIDVHVHLRDPGFFYKETISSGTKACARGGYTTVLSMPNLNPPPDCMENLQVQLDIIKSSSVINVIPYANITKGANGKELSNMAELSKYVLAFTDDGKGVQNRDMIEKAMIVAKGLDRLIVAHCEDESLLNGGYIHDGEYAKINNHKGISSQSEWKMVERDIELAKKTGVKYHICHISTKETVELVRKAKAEGVRVTCETAPHYILLTDMDLKDSGDYKMNPPIRALEDKNALIEGIKDGTIDMIATDHAPHSSEEKSKGLEKSNMGIVGVETAFPLLYTNLVKTNIITLEKLIELMSINPSKIFGIKTDINKNYTVIKLDNEYAIDPNNFLSKGKSMPFKGWKVLGEVILTVSNGGIAWKSNMMQN